MSAAPEKHVQEDTLRVALVAGELRQGGAEKQLVYIARALDRAGVQVKIFSLTRGDYYEGRLAALGLPPVWFGMHANPLARIISLAHAGRGFRPHILQSAHYFTNLHVAIAARLIGISRPLSIGCIRSDPQRFRSPSLLRLPSALIANSSTAREHAIQAGVSPQKVHVLPNVIDLEEFDSAMLAGFGQAVCGQPSAAGPKTAWPKTAWPKPASKYVTAITVSRLIPVKRLEVFLKALALARQEAPELRGVLAGEGSERGALEKLAADLGLLSAISFLGHQENIPALLSQADMLILTSEYEGFPNVLLEAMAACLPVITTPAGDAGLVVQDGITGFVVPHGDVKSLANRMVLLAKNTGKSAAWQSPARQSAARPSSASLRRQLGEAGRRRVERTFSSNELAPRLLWLYQEIAQARGDRRLLDRLVAPLIQG